MRPETAVEVTANNSRVPSVAANGGAEVSIDAKGKHRVMAELKRLEQEARSLEGELAELEKIDQVSSVCPELLYHIGSRPDPLLPMTVGPTNPSWERWFEGPQELKGCSCWIL